jgi:hypothetical protein
MALQPTGDKGTENVFAFESPLTMDLSRRSLLHSSPISNIPSEVLQIILALAVPEPEKTVFRRDGPIQYRKKPRYGTSQLWQLLLLRSVCRRFRAVANELSIWFSGDFELLRSNYANGANQVQRDLREGRIMKALVADSHLVQSLGRRAEWTFQSLQCLLTVVQGVPGFRENAESITLDTFNDCYIPGQENDDDLPSNFEPVIHLLANCSRLTSLRLEDVGGFDLGAIALSCPSLKRISLHNVDDCHGALKRLSNLEFLEIDDDDERDDRILSDFLPTNSVEILSGLSICYGIDSRYISPLRTLAALTYLWIKPFRSSFCDAIINANFKLVTFGVIISWTSYWFEAAQIAKMFAAPSLQGLENLTFRFLLWNAWDPSASHPSVDNYAAMVDSISSLFCLRFLTISMPLDISWCPRFVNLRDLISLDWQAPPGSSDMDGIAKLQEEFQKMYAHLVKKPTVKISQLGN